MAKYLDSNGLHVVWARVKELVGNVIKVNVTDKLGKANGLATLGSDGKLTGSQLPAFKTVNGASVVGSGDITIDLSLYKVVTALPATGDPSKIYLVAKAGAPEGDVYTEHAWVNGKWEKLGEYKAAVDLSPYIKEADLDINFTRHPNGEISFALANGNEDITGDCIIPAMGVNTVDSRNAPSGLMLKGDKEILDHYAGCRMGYLEVAQEYNENHVIIGHQNKGPLDDIEYQDVFLNAATSTSAGVMTADMCAKLNGIASSATSDSELTEAEILEVLK